MLGYCRKITLFEYGAANVEYLRGEIKHLSDPWKPFWEIVAPFVGNRDFEWTSCGPTWFCSCRACVQTTRWRRSSPRARRRQFSAATAK
ncbi:hypothetical protein GCM10023088_50070 [Actinomadura verrucosospora]